MIGNRVVNILNRLRMYDAAASIIRLLNAHRPSEVKDRVKAIKKLLENEEPIVLEIGSHNGSTTMEFLRAFRNVRIYCFEPDPRNIAAFKARVKDDRCVLEELAVSNEDGETSLHMSTGWPDTPRWLNTFHLNKRCIPFTEKEWTGSSSIKESVPHSCHHPWLTFNKITRVKTLRLDTWIRKKSIAHVDFILLDVQGAERDVINGAVETLKFTRYVLTEYGETCTYPQAMDRDETISRMQKHNFEVMPEYSSDAEAEVGDLLFRNKAFKTRVEISSVPTNEVTIPEL